MTAPRPRPTGCITVDWEDFGQLYCWYNFRQIPAPRGDIDRQTSIVLDLLADAGARATFFVLGMLARHRPELVRRIHAAGHEIALHGSDHVPFTTLDRAAVTRDVGDALALVTDLIGAPVHGFRAPVFSITAANTYVLDVLAELGLGYDSSIFPIKLRRYGIAGFDPEPRHYRLPEGGTLVELPLTVVPWAGRTWPASGGGYLRLAPARLLDPALDRLATTGRPLILYTHPYEYDTEPLDVGSNFPADARYPAWKRAALNARWNLFRRSFRDKTRHLLGAMSLATCKELADDVRNRENASVLG
jgi:polysaccharide deacetylase family protein (PEP-CTERM system associated)